jgi:hypothetical protein
VDKLRIKILTNYLRENRQHGKEKLKEACTSSGYTNDEFEKAWGNENGRIVTVIALVWIVLMSVAVTYIMVCGKTGVESTNKVDKQVDTALKAEGLKVQMNGMTVYLQRGQIVRVEEGNTVMIKTADNLVAVDQLSKTYRVLKKDAPQFSQSFPLVNIVRDVATWSEINRDTWEAEWTKDDQPTVVRIHVDPNSGLVDEYYLKPKLGGEWLKTALTYETVTGMADLMKIPVGYSASSL